MTSIVAPNPPIILNAFIISGNSIPKIAVEVKMKVVKRKCSTALVFLFILNKDYNISLLQGFIFNGIPVIKLNEIASLPIIIK